MPVFWDDDASGEKSARPGLRAYYDDLIRNRESSQGRVSDEVRFQPYQERAIAAQLERNKTGRIDPPWKVKLPELVDSEREYQREVARRFEARFAGIMGDVPVMLPTEQRSDDQSTVFRLYFYQKSGRIKIGRVRTT